MSTAPPSISLDRVTRLLEEELALFKSEVLSDEVEERRARLIEWIAVFIPEAVSSRFEKKLVEFVLEVRGLQDFRTRLWYLMLSLDAALFRITGETSWLDTVILNVDHHSSVLRRQAHLAVALVAPQLSLYHPDLHERMLSNLEKRHFFNDRVLAVMTATAGESEAKRNLLQEWSALENLNQSDRDMLQMLVDGKALPNPLACELYRTQQYGFLRLASSAFIPGPEPPRQTMAFHPSDAGAARALAQGRVALDPVGFFDIVDERIFSHPLLQAFVRLEKTSP